MPNLHLTTKELEALLGHLEDDLEAYDDEIYRNRYERLPVIERLVKRLRELNDAQSSM
jgi:hypothetical protein